MRSFNNQAQPKSDVLLNLMYNPNDRFIKFDGLQRLVVILNSNNQVNRLTIGHNPIHSFIKFDEHHKGQSFC